MTIKKFDKANLKTIRRDVEAALAEVAKKHNINFEVGGIRFFATTFKCTLSASTENAKSDAVESAGIWNGIDAKIGDTFTTMGRTFKIVDYHRRKHKYPWIAEDNMGNRFKFSNDQIRAHMKKVA